MQWEYNKIMRVIHLRKVAAVILVPVGLIAIILTIHLAGIIYYYSDYIVLLLPNPPLPVLKRPKDNLVPVGISFKGPDTRKPPKYLPRILCLIVTSPKYHDERASHVAATWAQHCNTAVFLTSQRDVRLPKTVLTPNASSYRQLWSKVKQGFEWAYDNLEDYDWVYKCDDDTFVVVENLQSILASMDPKIPVATGNQLSTWERDSTYLNGGAGYVLSRGAVTKLVEEGIRSMVCEHNLIMGTNEDVNMADCLTYLGVELLDSRDALKRNRFHAYPPQVLIDPRQENSLSHLWLKKKSVFPYKFGYGEMSNEVVSFHYVDAQTMYLLYYLIYIVNPVNADRIGSIHSVDHQTDITGSKPKG